MSLKKINKKIIDKEIKIKYSTEKLLRNKDSPLFCDKCEERLGLVRMIFYAWGKKRGEKYLVPCKNCLTINLRIKGQIEKDIDSDWAKYGVEKSG